MVGCWDIDRKDSGELEECNMSHAKSGTRILIVDFLNRWKWIYAAILLFGLCGNLNLNTIQRGQGLFTLIVVAALAGPILLGLDHARGCFRVSKLMPISRLRTGLAMWLAVVFLLPAAAAVLTLAECAIVWRWNGNIGLRRPLFCALYSLVMSVGLAGVLLLFHALNPVKGKPEGFWQRLLGMIWGLTWGLSCGCLPWVLILQRSASALFTFPQALAIAAAAALLSCVALLRFIYGVGEPLLGVRRGDGVLEPRVFRASDVSFHTFSHPWMRHVLQRIARTVSVLLPMGAVMILVSSFFGRVMLYQEGLPSTGNVSKALNTYLMPVLMTMMAMGAVFLVAFLQELRTLRILPFSMKTLFAGILLPYLMVSAVGMMPVCWALWMDGSLTDLLSFLVAIFPVVAGVQLLVGCTFPRWGYQAWVLSMAGAVGFLVGGAYAMIEMKTRVVFLGAIQGVIFCVGILLLAAGATWLYSLLRNSSAAYQTKTMPFAKAAMQR
jgi:hypothetical protein